MKGLLQKTTMGWHIKDPLLETALPMHSDDEPHMDSLRFEGKEVEFEPVPVCENCGHDWCDNLACRGQGDIMFARLIIPPLTWDDIQQEYNKCFPPFSAPYPDFLTWVKENYNVPTKKK